MPFGTDSKLAMQVDLESMIALSNSLVVEMEEAVNSRPPFVSTSTPGEKRKATEFDTKVASKKRKKHKVEDHTPKRMRKSAIGNSLPFENKFSPTCAKCKDYEQQLRNLEEKLAVCQSDLEDACLAKAAKFSIIQGLRAQLKESKAELERKSLLLSRTVEENVKLLASAKGSGRQGKSIPPGIFAANSNVV